MKAYSATVASCTLCGLTAAPTPVTVYYLPEVHDMDFAILHATAATSAPLLQRLQAAFEAQRLSCPPGCYLVHLQDLKLLEHNHFDLPIAIGMLIASQQLSAEYAHERVFCGGVRADGALEPLHGVLPILSSLAGTRQTLIVPRAQVPLCERVAHTRTLSAETLQEVIRLLRAPSPQVFVYEESAPGALPLGTVDLSQVPRALLRAIAAAAAGGHSLCLIGADEAARLTPTLARVLHAMLPPLRPAEAFEAGCYQFMQFSAPLPEYGRRPFLRLTPPDYNPYRQLPRNAWTPGPIAANHHGVLLLEIPTVTEGVIYDALLASARERRLQVPGTDIYFPVTLQVVSAVPPCPCYRAYEPRGGCKCTEQQKRRVREHLARLYELCHLQLLPHRLLELPAPAACYSDEGELRALINRARERAYARGPQLNAQLAYVPGYEFPLTAEARQLEEESTQQASERQALAALALTLCDLDGAEEITPEHEREALQLRGHFA